MAPKRFDGRRHDESVSLTTSPYLGERHDTRHARAIVWTVVLAICFFFYWASQTPVYQVVSGQGTIRPEGLSKRIEHLEGGIVADVLVEEGDIVDAGDVLLTLDSSDLVAEKRKLLAQIDRLDQATARYDALLALDLAGAERDEIAAMIEGAAPSFAEELVYRIAQIEVIDGERQVALAQKASLESRHAKSLEELALLRLRHGRYDTEAGRRAVPLRQLEEIEREVIKLETEVRSLEGEVLVQDAALARAGSAEAELIAGYRREAAERLEQAHEDRAKAAETLSQVEERLERAVLTTPIAGTVKGLSVQGGGEVLAEGEAVMEIVPRTARAFAEVEVPADRIGGVEPGQSASLKILTHDFTRFGDVTARVERVSPSSFSREQGPPVFRVKLTFDATRLTPLDGSGSEIRAISPGMTVMADIKSSRQTILAYLLKPLRVISDRALTEA